MYSVCRIPRVNSFPTESLGSHKNRRILFLNMRMRHISDDTLYSHYLFIIFFVLFLLLLRVSTWADSMDLKRSTWWIHEWSTSHEWRLCREYRFSSYFFSSKSSFSRDTSQKKSSSSSKKVSPESKGSIFYCKKKSPPLCWWILFLHFISEECIVLKVITVHWPTCVWWGRHWKWV